MWKKIKNLFKKIFNRESRVELAVKIVKAIKTFTDTTMDDIIIYALAIVAPASTAATALVKKFINDDLSSILLSLQLIDASDESKTVSEQCALVSKKLKEHGNIEDETALAASIATALEDGELTFTEAKELINNYIKNVQS